MMNRLTKWAVAVGGVGLSCCLEAQVATPPKPAPTVPRTQADAVALPARTTISPQAVVTLGANGLVVADPGTGVGPAGEPGVWLRLYMANHGRFALSDTTFCPSRAPISHASGNEGLQMKMNEWAMKEWAPTLVVPVQLKDAKPTIGQRPGAANSPLAGDMLVVAEPGAGEGAPWWFTLYGVKDGKLVPSGKSFQSKWVPVVEHVLAPAGAAYLTVEIALVGPVTADDAIRMKKATDIPGAYVMPMLWALEPGTGSKGEAGLWLTYYELVDEHWYSSPLNMLKRQFIPIPQD